MGYRLKEVSDMIVNYDIQKIGQVLDDFYNATGINISLWDADFKFLNCRESTAKEFCQRIQATDEGFSRCCMSDQQLFRKCQKSGKMEIQVCHAGLVDVIVPILQNGIIANYLLLGQMKRTPDFSAIAGLLSWQKADFPALLDCYEKIPYYDSKKINSVVHLAVMLAEYILFSDLLKLQHDRNVETATEYIRCHLAEELTVQTICHNTNISKSVLYKSFQKYLNCTISEFINAERIKKAKELILSESLSMEEVALRVGFSDSSYFCKTFKKLTGKTPLQYKKVAG